MYRPMPHPRRSGAEHLTSCYLTLLLAMIFFVLAVGGVSSSFGSFDLVAARNGITTPSSHQKMTSGDRPNCTQEKSTFPES